MTTATAIEIAANISQSEEKGKLINWKTIPWHLPIGGYDEQGNSTGGNQNEYWATIFSWEKLAKENGLDDAIAGKDGDIWVSQALFECAQNIQWEIPIQYRNWSEIEIITNLRTASA